MESNGKPTEPNSAIPQTDGPAVDSTPANAEEAKKFNTITAPKLIGSDNTSPTTQSEHDASLPETSLPEASLPETSRAGTYTVPYQDTHTASPPPDSRQGTSITHFEQQGGTHAEGQLEHGTPNVTVDGQGTSHTIMEPRTVGQAPKETPLVDEEEAKTGVLEQAQNIVGGAVESVQALPGVVLGAVGLGGGKGEDVVKDENEKKEDSRVDGLSDGVVEEFVRERNMTKQTNGEK